MKSFYYKNREYLVDASGYLVNPRDWDENFASGMVARLDAKGSLTKGHWKIIHYLREKFEQTGSVPLVYAICKDNNFTLKEFKKLFPEGNQRGACKLAGLSFRSRVLPKELPSEIPLVDEATLETKVYRIDAWGFLVEPAEWDENFAVNKADELKIPSGITDKHWEIIKYLRNTHAKMGAVPNIFQVCEDNNMELEELERLFPDGYHRGAVKIAGLRL